LLRGRRKKSGFYTDPDSGSWTAPEDGGRAKLERIRTLIGEYVNETQRRIDDFGSFQNAAD
jgi:hypothetical protein